MHILQSSVHKVMENIDQYIQDNWQITTDETAS